ncbi:MAG TPA: universal stress protein [Planctomycetota bacterium]|nr:universal stress protein [Planctomycetota bacterium]
MISFKKIVLTTDLSDNANVAAPYAVELAKKWGGQISLVHVVEDVVYYANPAATEGIVPVEWMVANRKDREMQLKLRAEELAKKDGVTVKDVLLQGHAANAVVDYLKKEKADCVVIATHGRTGLSHLIMGSVAERIVRLSPCPVLSIRPPQK